MLLTLTTLTGCTKIHSLVLWRPMDFIQFPIYYILLAFLFGKLLQVFDNQKRTFNYFFHRNLFFTPVYGFVKILMKFK